MRPIRVIAMALVVGMFLFGGVALGQGYFHIVEKGDTLWDICEKYYGDPFLWPKLWEMNPFVTNPHLLKPGDKIRLLEDYPFKKAALAKKPAKKVEATPKKEWWEEGLEISSLTNVQAVGYLSVEKPIPLGRIVSSDSRTQILAEDDVIYIEEMAGPIKAGSSYSVYKCSKLLDDPISGEPLGYVVAPLGRIKVLEKTGEGLYKATVAENYEEIHVGDLISHYHEISSCVKPVNASLGLESRIAAVKGQRRVVGQFDVVYLLHGKGHGIQRGNLFKILKERRGPGTGVMLPELTIGYLLVVTSLQDSASGVIVMSTETIPNGSLVKIMRWDEAPQYLGGLPACAVE